MDDLMKIKLLLLIEDDKQDKLLALIKEETESRLLSYMNQDGGVLKNVPDDLSWIVRELVIRRYNRIGDEGKKSSTESDVTATWDTDDLAEYIIYLDKHRKKIGGNGVARFY